MAARKIVRAALIERGYAVHERPCTYSAWPGLWATPVLGLVLTVAAILIAVGVKPNAIDAPLTLGTSLMSAAAIAGALIVRYGTTFLPWLRRDGMNLEATRASVPAPDVWLLAHLDSKSQWIPMALRIASVVVTGAAWLAILLLWTATFVAHVPASLFVTFAWIAAAGTLPMIASITGTNSPGALDNASGVATLLATLDLLDPRQPVGVLITTAEELGLAGARAWLHEREGGLAGRAAHRRQHIAAAVAVNFDSIDDEGTTVCMLAHDPATWIRQAARATSTSLGESVSIRGGVPGVLVDAIAFKDAGWPAVTISRGRWASFARIHTRRDTLERVRGSGIEPAARFAAGLVRALSAPAGPHVEPGTN